MDPVPVGLGLALIAVILYLIKEMGDRDRALASAQERLDEFQKLVAERRPEIGVSRAPQIESPRRENADDIIEVGQASSHRQG